MKTVLIRRIVVCVHLCVYIQNTYKNKHARTHARAHTFFAYVYTVHCLDFSLCLPVSLTLHPSHTFLISLFFLLYFLFYSNVLTCIHKDNFETYSSVSHSLSLLLSHYYTYLLLHTKIHAHAHADRPTHIYVFNNFRTLFHSLSITQERKYLKTCSSSTVTNK